MIVGRHIRVGSENAVLVLVPLPVEAAAAGFDAKMMRGKVVRLIASDVLLVKVSPMPFLVVPLTLEHDSKPLLSSEGLLLLLLLLEVMAG